MDVCRFVRRQRKNGGSRFRCTLKWFIHLLSSLTGCFCLHVVFCFFVCFFYHCDLYFKFRLYSPHCLLHRLTPLQRWRWQTLEDLYVGLLESLPFGCLYLLLTPTLFFFLIQGFLHCDRFFGSVNSLRTSMKYCHLRVFYFATFD